MKTILRMAPYPLSMWAAAAMFAGCSGGSQLFPTPPAATQHLAPQHQHSKSTAQYVYVSNRTKQGASELLVYPAGVKNPTPTRTVKQNLVNVTGIDTDSQGNVYVANGSGGNVLEYAPGATSLIQTYSQGLAHPADVAVANGTLYVTDQGNAANGYLQQVIEYTIGNGKPSLGIGGLEGAFEPNEGIAVDPVESPGPFFMSASSLSSVPNTGACPPGSTFQIAKNLAPTLWVLVPLSNNQQVWGLAFDSNGLLYAADPCANDIAIYSDATQSWTYQGTVSGTFDAPLFLTINKQFLVVPNAGTHASSSGYVSVIDLSGETATVTVTNDLYEPIGAAIGLAP